MMNKLVVPTKLPRLHIQGYQGAGEKIIAFSSISSRLGNSVSRREVNHSEIGVHNTFLPDSTATESPGIIGLGPSFTAWFTRVRDREKVPHFLTIFSIESDHAPAQIEIPISQARKYHSARI